MRLPVTIITLFLFVNFCFSQSVSEDKKSITLVIEKLFTGMKKGDSTMVRETFSTAVTLATSFRNKASEPVLIKENSIQEFLIAVGTAHKQVWHEEYWDLTIQIDGDIASAWCNYAFYLDNTFSHCGVDAFHLHKGKNGWKIFHLTDTRRKEGCVIPDAKRKKHIE
jgi:hypothetical protein